MPPVFTAFNRNFKTIREELGLQPEQIVAEMPGLSVSIIRNIESGRTQKFSDITLYKKMEAISGFTREELHNTEITAAAVRNRQNRNKPGHTDDEVIIQQSNAQLIMDVKKLTAAVQVLFDELAPLKAKNEKMNAEDALMALKEKTSQRLKVQQS